jgi:thiamine pyrophosphate-dependent acetolactate synthase large subunit-like protein
VGPPFRALCEPPARPQPPADDVVRAARLLAAARQPLVVAGGGCLDAAPQLAALAERLDSPVLLTGNAKGALSSDHPLCVGNALSSRTAQQALEAADAVLVVGSSTDGSRPSSASWPMRAPRWPRW